METRGIATNISKNEKYKEKILPLARQDFRFGGVGGIRTLGTLLTYTRFPVVLVMTASIPLRIPVSAAA